MLGKGRKRSSKWSLWQGFGLEPQQSNLHAYVCVLWRQRGMHKGRRSQAREIYLYELISFLLSSSPPHLFFCLSLLGDESHLLCPDATISHQKHTVTLMSPKLFCARPLHCLHVFFGVQGSNAVMESVPVTQHRHMKCSHLPVTCWCLDGIIGFQPTGNTILEWVIEFSLCQRNYLYENPGKTFINWHQVLR